MAAVLEALGLRLGAGIEISGADGRRPELAAAHHPEQAAAICTWIDTGRRRAAAGLRAAARAAARAPCRAQTVNPDAHALSRGPAGGAAARQGPNR